MLGMIRKLAVLRGRRRRKQRATPRKRRGWGWGVWFGLFLAAVFSVFLALYAVQILG